MDGVSLTHGHPREHIWTFAAGFHEYVGIPEAYSYSTMSLSSNRFTIFVSQEQDPTILQVPVPVPVRIHMIFFMTHCGTELVVNMGLLTPAAHSTALHDFTSSSLT